MDLTIEQKYPLGTRPDIHFLPYLIFISYIVSFVGAFTTVELLHRRISGTGWRSWVQLGACAVSFGLVAIWCMHFVGNRAIVLGDGEDAIQLYYSPAFTAVSAVLPIVVIFLGLTIADRFYRGNRKSTTRYMALVVCGVCCGASVSGMHYLGNGGTTDYRVVPVLQFIIGASAIAIGVCILALTLFFHWAGHWMNNIWRRLVVACICAVAVCGMHWTAAAGTYYEVRGYHQGSGQARNVNVIIAIPLCLGACVVCFAMGFLKQRQQRLLRDRAKQVVLAVATFDASGRLLVTHGGLLPCQTITKQFHQRMFAEDLNTRHPVFQWVYRVSRNWGGIVDMIPAMRDHLQHTGYMQIGTPKDVQSRSSIGEDDSDASYSVIFREMFCVTAQDIARSMETRLQDLGYLFEDVLTTGTLLTKTLFRDAQGKTVIATDVDIVQKDVEMGQFNPRLFGRGQLLVLTRQVGTEEANRLQDIGYRFASTDQIGDQLARSLQVSRHDLNGLMIRLQAFCERTPPIPSAGTYLASFLLQPSPVMKGLDIIVEKATPDRLPMVKFSSEELSSRQKKILASFNGCTLDQCLHRIQARYSMVSEEDIFLEKFRNKIQKLLALVPEPVLHQAIFSSTQLDIAHGVSGPNDARRATVFAFCGIKEVYNQSLQSLKLQFVPLSFFKANLRSYPGCPDHEIFARKNHKEFSSFLTPPADNSLPSKYGKWTSIFRTHTNRAISETALVNPDSSSEKGLVTEAQPGSDTANTTANPFAGIMVSQEVVISEDQKDGGHIEMHELGVRSEAGVADTEQLTMADRLMSLTSSFRDPHAKILPKDSKDFTR